jgi:thiamine biosynthesis lipoprotein
MAIAPDSVRRARPLLGTFVEVAVSGRAQSELDTAVDAAFRAVAEVHRLMSFHDRESDVGRLNREAHAHAVAVDAWTFRVLQTSLDLHQASGGIFDITIAPVLQEMGLLPGREAGASSKSPKPRSMDGIELLPGRRVRFHDPGVAIDLGGIAKGFAVDRAVEALRDRGVPSGVVNAGGDLAAFGPKPHSVYIRDPGFPQRLLGRVELGNEALASSGGRHDPFRAAEVFDPAIVDPRTRAPARIVRGATVRAASCMLADALTKVVMIAGKTAAALLREYRASAFIVSADGEARVTADWQHAVCLAA